MKKKTNKVLCLLLSVVVFTGIFASCKANGGEGVKPSVGEDTDIGKIVKTDKIIVADGKTDYKILLPENADSELVAASNELKLLFSEATGVNLVSTSTYVNGNKYFSLGNTVLAKDNGLTCTYEELGFSGYKIKTIEDSICINAYDSTAVIYGVYEYLERMLNFDCYFVDVYSIDKVSTLNLYDFDCVDVPDFERRVSGAAYVQNDTTGTSRTRMRLDLYYQTFLNNTGYGSWHNCWWAAHPRDYYDLYPEWYNEDFRWSNAEEGIVDDSRSQLCYSAHGNEESLTKLLEVTANKAFDLFMNNPSDNELSLNVMDNEYECDCGACNADAEKYGARSATVILFFNRLAALLEEKFAQTDDPRKDTWKLSFYAYGNYRQAPVTKTVDEKGNVTYNYHPDMVLSPRVSPMYAGDMDLSAPVDSEKNTEYYDNMFKWKEISSQMHLWLYDFYFWDYGSMVYFDSLDRYQEHLRLMRDAEADWVMFEQHGHCPTSFLGLRQYISQKLMWNVDDDVVALTDKYFKAMYGTESETLKKLYSETKALVTRNTQELGMTIWHQGRGLGKTEYWPKTVMLDRYERMIAAEDKLRESGQLIAADNVKREAMAPLYMLIDLYRLDYSPEVRTQYIQTMKDMFDYFGYTTVSQSMTITNMLPVWSRS